MGVCGGILQSNQLDSDEYTSYDELNAAIQACGVNSMQCVLSLDFSASNGDLHALANKNPYMRVIELLHPIIQCFDADQIINAYRFGCSETKDQCVMPLWGDSDQYIGFEALGMAYINASKCVEMSGPSAIGPTVRKCIELEKSMGGHQLIVCTIVTDGGISNIEEDLKVLQEASYFPISFVLIGVGEGPFRNLETLDNRNIGLFDNVQFVKFQEVERKSQGHIMPQLALSCAVFNELPEQYQAMRELGYVK